MEPTLVVIGISLRSAKLAIRERFIMDPAKKAAALDALVRSDAVDEVIVLSNCNRTEFLVWTQDASEAANSVLRFLARSNNLKLAEWSNFYRLVGDAAVAHVLRVASGVDSAVFGEPEATSSMLTSWQQAQRASTTGRFLDSLMAKAFNVAAKIRQELGVNSRMMTVAEAAVAICREALGDMKKRRVLVLGAGQMALAAVRELQNDDTGEITVINRSWDHAQYLAKQCKIKAQHAESIWEQMLTADVVIAAAAEKIQITAAELDVVMRERKNKRLVIVDVAVPRTVEAQVRLHDGVSLHDLDDLCAAMDVRDGRRATMPVAERMIAEEALGFRGKMLCESVLPTISGIRERLERICRQEVEQLKDQFGPFTEDQDLVLAAFSAHVTQRIAASLARQLKELPDRPELTSAIQQLFQLDELKHEKNVKVCD
jgi:glutamyl-tRNA reductase